MFQQKYIRVKKDILFVFENSGFKDIRKISEKS